MNINNISPLTKPTVPKANIMGQMSYDQRVDVVGERVGFLEQQIRDLMAQEEREKQIETSGAQIPEDVLNKILGMRGEMRQADVKEKSIKEENKLIYKELEDVSKGKFSGLQYNSFTDKFYEEDPILSEFVFDALREGRGHYSNEIETMDFTKEIYKKLASNYGKKEIKLEGEPAYTFDRFRLKPSSVDDEPNMHTEYKKDEDGDSYAHITNTESKTYTIFGKKPYELVETIEYSWDVDTYTDEYGDEVADDEDIGYENAETKVSYKLVRK